MSSAFVVVPVTNKEIQVPSPKAMPEDPQKLAEVPKVEVKTLDPSKDTSTHSLVVGGSSQVGSLQSLELEAIATPLTGGLPAKEREYEGGLLKHMASLLTQLLEAMHPPNPSPLEWKLHPSVIYFHTHQTQTIII